MSDLLAALLQEVEVQRYGANLVFVLPDILKGAVVWLEAR